ncbi:phosphatase PAP2 family protein [Flagellimonas alvinocaridis]|uniref:Phosphatase PAP2 family protein n=1 Tax=Flagellimonas alvinocaridis TaxID=2530200 RepID=A0A4S8RNT5_9FLAO|nr:phosphatase PAP2 family protein [Allomuricauda alvinocaridis]THV60277.1 phosphatase PAP2 family protein [Allomuricauda alvinocaridis]
MLDQLLQYDKDLFLFLNGLGTPTWDGFWMFMTKTKNSFPLYVLLLYLSYKNFGWKKTGVILVSVALLITCTDQLSNFFKYGIGRLRPCHDPEINGVMRLVKSYCGGQFGYFSAHAANSFGPATFFMVLFCGKVRYMGFILMIWACLVAYSRIYIGVHFPLDVLTGAIVGLLFGWLFAKLAIFAFQKTGT